MEEKILTTVKRMLGIPEEVEDFDLELLLHINSVFAGLAQMGTGESEGFTADKETLWSDYTTDKRLSMAIDYVFLKVKMIFDPPTNSSASTSYENRIKELEYRMFCLSEFNNGD